MIDPLTIDERRGCTSASNAAADAACPGRFLAQRGLPRIETEYATEGRVIHDALATGKLDGLTVEQVQTVERCLEIERRKLVEFFGAEDAPKAQAFRENPADPASSRMWMRVRGNGQEYEHSCRTDVVYRVKDRALIIEYKTLFGDVPDSPRNLQLRDQQVIVRGNLLITGDIGVVVIQPWVESNPQICVYSANDSRTAERELMQRVVASHNPEAPRVYGDLQCQHCLAKRNCAEYQKHAGALVPAMMSVLEVPMAEWTPQQRRAAADALKPARDLIDTISDFLREGLERDANFCPGWYLKPGNEVEKITDPQKVFDRFTKVGGTLADFMSTITVGKSKLKSALAKTTGAKGKSLEAAMKTLTDGLVETKHNSPSLKPVGEDLP